MPSRTIYLSKEDDEVFVTAMKYANGMGPLLAKLLKEWNKEQESKRCAMCGQLQTDEEKCGGK